MGDMKVADMVPDIKVDKVADMKVEMVVDMELDIVADMKLVRGFGVRCRWVGIRGVRWVQVSGRAAYFTIVGSQ